MSGGAGGGSPAPASPAARSGLGSSVHMPDARSDAHEHARWQSVQWLGRDGRGCSGTRRALECAGARLPSGSGAGGGPCPQKTCPGIGRMCRSNPRPDRRPTLVTAAVQPRCDTRARRRRPRHATPPRATHRHGTVTNLGGTTTRRHPRRTPAAAQPPPPPPPRGCLRALPCPGKSDDFGPETSCTSKQVLSSVLQ